MNSLVASLSIILITSQLSVAVFITEPQDGLIYSGNSVPISLTCESDTNGVKYSWRKDNTPLDISDGAKYEVFGETLDIKNPDQNDVGRYQCVASSENGIEVSNYGELKYAYINDFPPDRVTVTRSEHIHTGVAIPCTGADFYPANEVDIAWRTRQPFGFLTPPGNNNYYISPKTGTLYFSSVEAQRAATYTCEISSKWSASGGVKTSNTVVQLSMIGQSVSHPPLLLLSPENANTTLGGAVLLECFAGGNPVPTLTWTRNSGDLPTKHRITSAGQLVLFNITADMAGTYTCIASNIEGTAEASAEVVLQYAPQWVEELPSEIDVDLSKSTVMRCAATAVPDASFIWLKDGLVLTSSDKLAIISNSASSRLELLDASDKDAGMYQCVATNDHGYIFTSTKLNVNQNPPEFEESVPDKTQAYTGSNITITCIVRASPAANVTWKKENKTLSTDGQKYSLKTRGSLIIRNIIMEDAGRYTCTARNMLGEKQSEGALLVYTPTMISSKPEDMEMREGETTTLTCVVEHDQGLSVSWKWKQNNHIIRNDQHYRITGSSLVLLEVTSAQTGEYKCCAVTEVGQVCGRTMVTVTARPDPPYDVMVSSSKVESQTISWKAPDANGANITSYVLEGKNEYDDAWLSMVTMPSIINVTSCVVLNLLPYNAYSYRIAAWNKIGRSDFSKFSSEGKTLSSKPSVKPTEVGGGGGMPGQLVVIWKPIHEKYFGSEDVDYRVFYKKHINLPNVNGSNPNGKVLKEKIVKGGKQRTTNITVNADEIHVPYVVTVEAFNDVGEGPRSNEATVYTAEIGPTMAPTGIYLKWAKASSAELRWVEVVDENGYTKGYKVEVCSTYIGCKVFETEDEQPKIVIEELKEKTKYTIRVAAFNLGGTGPWSSDADEAFEFTTAGPPPDVAPSNVVIRVKDRQLRASWDPVPPGEPGNEVQGYWVQYWLSKETMQQADYKATTKEVTHSEFDLPLEADYTVCVRAFNRGGEGRRSAEIRISTRLGTTAKYHGGNGSSVRSSVTLLIFATILWFFVCVMQ